MGSGGGVPGFILLDTLHVPATLLDAMEKRCRFLVEQLDQPEAPLSVSVVTGRAEILARQTPYQEAFDWVVVRSFGQPANTAECASRFLRLGGLLTVSEPPNTPSETRWPQEGLAQLGLRRLTEDGPGTGYVVIEKIAPTPEQFPRRDGVPAKKLLFGS